VELISALISFAAGTLVVGIFHTRKINRIRAAMAGIEEKALPVLDAARRYEAIRNTDLVYIYSKYWEMRKANKINGEHLDIYLDSIIKEKRK